MCDPFANLVNELFGATTVVSSSVIAESDSTVASAALSDSRRLTAAQTVHEEYASQAIDQQQQQQQQAVIHSKSEGSASTGPASSSGSDTDFFPRTSSSCSSGLGFTSALDACTSEETIAKLEFCELSLVAGPKSEPAQLAATEIIPTFPPNPRAIFRQNVESPPFGPSAKRARKASQTVQKEFGKSLDLRAAAPTFTPANQRTQKLNVSAAIFQPRGSERNESSPKVALGTTTLKGGALVAATNKGVDALEIAKQSRRETGIPEPQELVPVHTSSVTAIENRLNSHRFESWNVPVGHPIFQASPSVPLSAMSTWVAHANEQAQLEHRRYYGDHSGWIDQRHISSLHASTVFSRHRAVASLSSADETSEYTDILRKTGFASIEEAKKILTSWAIISNYVHELARDAAAKNPTKSDLNTVNARFCMMRQLQKMVGLPD